MWKEQRARQILPARFNCRRSDAHNAGSYAGGPASPDAHKRVSFRCVGFHTHATAEQRYKGLMNRVMVITALKSEKNLQKSVERNE